MMFWLILIQLIPILVLTYFYINKKYSYWSNLGVQGPTPSVLQLGNVFQIAGSSNQAVQQTEWVRKYGKIYGTYSGMQPVLTVTDHEWVKRILVKDFASFVNRSKPKVDNAVMHSTLFFAEAEKWKRVRSITSPSFTTGKLRAMQSMIDKCVAKLDRNLREKVANEGGVINTKEVTASFTLDVIGSTSFALDINSNGDVKNPNSFLRHSLNFANGNIFQVLSFMSMPLWFNRLVKVEHLFNTEAWNYLYQLSAELLRQRKASPAKRNDLMQLLIDSYVYQNELNKEGYEQLEASEMDRDESVEATKQDNSKKTKLTDVEIIAQSMLFLSAGFETTSNTISHCIFELSQNPDFQDRLFTEVQNHFLEASNSDQHYDIVMHLPYLDAVVRETLRKYPPVTRLERRTTADRYEVDGITLRKDQLVEISIVAMHYNPEYYPDPDCFNPDRFLPENKDQLVPYTYLPFGGGPRNCVGMRFAYQEMKLCLAHLVKNFCFCPTEHTPVKLEYEPFKFGLGAKPFQTKVELR